MPESLLSRLGLNIAVVASLYWLSQHFHLIANSQLSWAMLALYAAGMGLIAWAALRLEQQGEWLHRGHMRARATDLVLPPSSLRAIYHLLLQETPAAQVMQATFSALGRRYRRLLAVCYGIAVLILACGLSLNLWILAGRPLQLGTTDAPQSLDTQLLLQHNMGWALLGLLLASSTFLATWHIRAQIRDNLSKCAELLAKKFPDAAPLEQPENIFHPFLTILIFAGLAALPLLGLQSFHTWRDTQRKGEINEMARSEEHLTSSLSEVRSRADQFAKDNASLMVKLDKLERAHSKLQKTLQAKTRELKKIPPLEKKVATLQQQLTSAQAEQATTAKNLTAQQQAQAALQQRYDAQTTQLAELKTQLKQETAAAETSATELNQLKAQKEALEKQLAALQAAAKPVLLNTAKWPAGVHLKHNTLTLPVDDVFVTDQDQLLEKAGPLLDQMTEQLSIILTAIKTPAVVMVYVHSGAVPPSGGMFASNDMLTAAQAQRIREHMVARGLPAKQLLAIGMGDADELDPRLEAAALAKNRRIEIKIERAK